MMKYQTGAHSLTEVHQMGSHGAAGAASSVCGSCCGAVFGFFLWIGACGLLWWNEQATVAIQQELDYLEENLVPVGRDLSSAGKHDGRAVHVTGPVKGSDLKDDAGPYTLSVKAVTLMRTSEMYQWVERKETTEHKRIAGSRPSEAVTNYEYYPTWTSSEVVSDHFKLPAGHQNPRKMPDRVLTTDLPEMGPLRLDGAVVTALPTKQISVTPEMVSGDVTISGGHVYLGKDERHPEIGDHKVHYSAFQDGKVASVIGVLTDGVVSGDRKSRVLPLVAEGEVDPKDMIAARLMMNTIFTWFCRFGGFILVWVGLALCINPINTVIDLIPLPFISGIARFITGAFLFASSIAITITVIALSWFVARPLMSITILAIAAATLWWGRDKRAAQRNRRD